MGIAVIDEAVKVHPVGVIEHAGRLHDGLKPLRDGCVMTGVVFQASMSL